VRLYPCYLRGYPCASQLVETNAGHNISSLLPHNLFTLSSCGSYSRFVPAFTLSHTFHTCFTKVFRIYSVLLKERNIYETSTGYVRNIYGIIENPKRSRSTLYEPVVANIQIIIIPFFSIIPRFQYPLSRHPSSLTSRLCVFFLIKPPFYVLHKV